MPTKQEKDAIIKLIAFGLFVACIVGPCLWFRSTWQAAKESVARKQLELADGSQAIADACMPNSERERRRISAYRKGCKGFKNELGETKETALRELVSALSQDCREAIAKEVWGY